MMINSYLGKLLAVLWALLLLPSLAAAQTIRVGVYSDTSFSAYDAEGRLHGQNINYLGRVAAYTGWQYEYSGYDNFYDALTALYNGDVDIIGGVIYMPERADSLLYSEYPSGVSTGMIMKSNLHKDLTKETLRYMDEVRIGVMQNYFRRAELEEYLKNWNVKIVLREYDNNIILMQAMNRGEIDLFAGHENEYVTGFTLFDYFDPQPFYFVVKRGDAALMEQLNAAQRRLLAEQPDFMQQQLRWKADAPLLLSKGELEYIRNTASVKIGVPANSWPLSFYDADDVSFGGRYIELLKLLEQRMSISFELVPMPEDVMVQEFLRQHRDVVGVFGYDIPDWDSIVYSGINISRPICQNIVQFAGRSETTYDREAGVRVTLLRDKFNYQKMVKSCFPNARIIWSNSLHEALKAIDEGEADLTLYNVDVLRRQLSQSEFQDLSILNGYIMTVDTVMALPQTGDWQFMSLLNKALKSLTRDELTAAVSINSVSENENVAMSNLWAKYRSTLLIMLLVVLSIMLLVYTKVRQRMEIQRRRHMLAEISGAIFFEYDSESGHFYCSEGFELELGYRLDERRGIMSECLHQADWPKFQQLLSCGCYGADRLLRQQLRFIDKHKHYVWYEVTARLLKNGLIVGNMKNIDMVMRDRDQYKLLASIDQLTGLLNKSSMLERMEVLLSRGIGGALFFIDLDNFKAINDQLGHNAGDEVLRDVALKLRKLFWGSDLTARFGGDEFFVFAPSYPEEKVKKRGEGLCRVLMESYGGILISASIGIVYIEDDSPLTVTQVLEMADKAAYVSKANGKNQYTIYDESLVFEGYTGCR